MLIEKRPIEQCPSIKFSSQYHKQYRPRQRDAWISVTSGKIYSLSVKHLHKVRGLRGQYRFRTLAACWVQLDIEQMVVLALIHFE